MANIRDIIHLDAKKEVKKSWAWYQTHVRDAAARMSAQKFLGDNAAHQTKSVMPGDFIMFFYDPKTKDDLPHYDTFPLVLPFSTTDTGFTGLNLHYLPPKVRMVLLDKLLDYANDQNMGPRTRIQASWSLLKNASAFPEVQPCVKQYLFSHVKSNFIVIPPLEWPYAIWLPLEMFKKSTNEAVWKGWRGK